MTVVNSKPVDPRFAKREELSTTDLRIEYLKHRRACLIGTREQLEAEGIPGISDKWPIQRGTVRWRVGGMDFSMALENKSRLRELYGRVPEERRYRVWLERATADHTTWARAELLIKLEEMEEIKYRWSAESATVALRAWEAQKDTRFMAHMAAIVGPTMPRRGGRPRAQNCA